MRETYAKVVDLGNTHAAERLGRACERGERGTTLNKNEAPRWSTARPRQETKRTSSRPRSRRRDQTKRIERFTSAARLAPPGARAGAGALFTRLDTLPRRYDVHATTSRDDLKRARCPLQRPAKPAAAAAADDDDDDADGGYFPPSPAHQSTIASDADAKARGGEDATRARSLPRRRFPAPSVAFDDDDDDDDDDDESRPDAPPTCSVRPPESPPPSRVLAAATPAAPTARAEPARDGAPATHAASASATSQ